MLTGDNQRKTEAVGHEPGISRVFAEVLPADKARYVKQLQYRGNQRYFTQGRGEEAKSNRY